MRWMLLGLFVLCGCDEDRAKRREEAAKHGASYPEGIAAVGLLVDMLDDADASVREAAAKSLAALGKKGLAELVRYLTDVRDPSHAALRQIGDVLARMGVAVTPADIASTMAANQRPSARRAGAATAIVVAGFDPRGGDVMIDVLTGSLRDADAGVRATASASVAVIGWTAVARTHPASADDIKDLLPMLGDPGKGMSWPSCIGACVITLLRPRAEWPEHVAEYPYAYREPEEPRESPVPVEKLREKLRELSESKGDAMRRQIDIDGVLRALRSKKSGAAEAKPELDAVLERERGVVRVEAARTLLAAVPEEREAVARALGDVVLERDPWASSEAMTVLAGMGEAARPAAPALIEVLGWSEEDDGDGKDLAGECAAKGAGFRFVLRSKRAAASILGHVGAKEAAPALKALADHKDARLRYRAATALRRITGG